MRQGQGRSRSAVGFTVKSGWTCAVLLAGAATSPRVLDSRRADLSDPAIPESRQPYHAGFATARTSGPVLSGLIASVERFGRQSVTGLIRQYQAVEHELRGAGVVVGSLIDPTRIGNEHIRIHALEGRLFRGVVEDAVARRRLACSIWRERDLYGFAAMMFKRPEVELRGRVAALGRGMVGPWRAEQKAAALAAWLVLAEHAPTQRTNRGRRPAAPLAGQRGS
jgi:hypothetical protein